ncbi:MAG: VacJ family lipoprotein [Verrucomicrobiota bacterium]
MKSRLTILGLAAATAILPRLSAQVAAPANETDPLDDYGAYDSVAVNDPLEPVNRAVFTFNDVVYEHVLWPVARGYERAVPADLRTGVNNVFNNVRYPVRLVSSLLQGKPGRAAQETSKFIVNTTVGMGGLFRVSDGMPALANVPAEDLGQTFGAWGIGHGPYLVLPVFGGMSSRDLVGRVGDAYVSPLGWKYVEWDSRRWTDDWGWEAGTAITVTEAISSLPGGLHLYREMKSSALDPYIAVRDGTISYRNEQVAR